DVSRVICPRRSRSLCGRPKPHLCPTCSTKRSTVSLGGLSRVGTPWPLKIAPSNPNCSASLQSAWGPQPSSCAPVTSRCSPSHRLCWTRSATPQRPFRNPRQRSERLGRPPHRRRLSLISTTLKRVGRVSYDSGDKGLHFHGVRKEVNGER